MKTKCLLVMILFVFVLTGCRPGPAPQTPAVTAPPVEAGPTLETLPAMATAAPPAPEDTQPPAAPIPSATAVEAAAPTPTTALPSATPLPATDAAPQITAAVISGETGPLPLEGAWSGSAQGLLLSFTITHENGQPMLSNLAVLWLGPGECTMDLLNPAATAIQPENFTRFYEDDDMRYRLTGRVEAPDLIAGKITVHYTGCGDRTLPWVARPQQ